MGEILVTPTKKSLQFRNWDLKPPNCVPNPLHNPSICEDGTERVDVSGYTSGGSGGRGLSARALMPHHNYGLGRAAFSDPRPRRPPPAARAPSPNRCETVLAMNIYELDTASHRSQQTHDSSLEPTAAAPKHLPASVASVRGAGGRRHAVTSYD
ncbi:hypothetical protein EVAR_59064_1 [Eumeta japonica]|uniref:Uncharacterized protein n=1 Tax=Eumeta variegata TaxID=151549 RepID=A0A4C1YFQ2_EUMVA|nr:hypothetical protein EVAR_59064_1 [Eumeta japonica]